MISRELLFGLSGWAWMAVLISSFLFLAFCFSSLIIGLNFILVHELPKNSDHAPFVMPLLFSSFYNVWILLPAGCSMSVRAAACVSLLLAWR